MLSRICSGWLVLLILLPFSAPFSTCDLTLFLGGRLGATHPVNRVGPVTQAPTVQDATTHALPHSRSALRDQWLVSHVDSPLAATIRPVSRAKRDVSLPTLVSPPVLPLRI